jgi:hypothetical protein
MIIKRELQNIISGNGTVRHGKLIQTINRYLRREKAAIFETEKAKFVKAQETEILLNFIDQKKLWFVHPDESKYIGEGAEQKIYEHADPKFIIKLNNSIFYEFWEDYFNNLLIHNFFFPHLAYELIGFCYEGGNLNTVVKQPFVKATEITNLDNVKSFLLENGFINKKANDYFHPEIGIIIEDLHDENVLTKDGTLQFIDTVFYLMPTFYEQD